MSICSFFFFLLLSYSACGYKMVLFVLDVSNSQLLFNERVAEPLSAAGHDITLVLMTPNPERDITDIKIQIHVVNATVGLIGKDLEENEGKFIYGELAGFKMIDRLKKQTTLIVETCRATLEKQSFLEWLKAEHFDLAFVPMFDVCSVGLVHIAKIPGWIWLNSGSVMDYIAYLTGIPIIPSYVPPMMMEATADMNFGQRVKSIIGHGLTKFIWTRFVANPETDLLRALISPDFPDLLELAAKCPLIMANTNDLYEMPRPTLAKVVNIGGVGMVSDAKRLPELLPNDIAKTMVNGDGVILFSFGSVAPAYKMPMEWKRILLETFKKFPNYQFLLRYEKDDIEDLLPPNVHLFTWFPQTDILHHPKTKAFITHGGYNSFQEALLAGVPLITIPLFGDQSKNARLAEHHGFGIVLHKGELSVETLYSSLKEIISNPKYTNAARRLSRMLRRQPVRPTDLLVKWAEFIAEFHTLDNLEPAGNKLGFFQYYSLDVIAVLLSALVLILLLIVKLLKFITVRVFSPIFRYNKQKVA